ncbi:MAG TPA: hypothetical protein DD738_14810 [Ruminiclostridium sp.]|nr:hypothetical protein [Ruminiclostridium sp.]
MIRYIGHKLTFLTFEIRSLWTYYSLAYVLGEKMAMDSQHKKRYHKRVKLIFNPVSGSNRESPNKLMDVIKELQAWKLVPEPYLTEQDSDFSAVVQDAANQGVNTIVVCGGDGTVSAVAKAMAGTNTTLGIIPTGTQNNIAFSLGIPFHIPSAISVLRNGKHLRLDMGVASCKNISTPFLEVCSVGLFSSLFESGDMIQHGNITRIGDFLATLTASPPSEIKLILNGTHEIKNTGHVVLISNMPYVGRRYQVGSLDSFRDGLLDVLICKDMSKLNLMVGYMLKVAGSNGDDSRFMNFRVRNIFIETRPPMTVMADGKILGEGSVNIEIRRRTLSVLAPDTLTLQKKAGESFEE